MPSCAAKALRNGRKSRRHVSRIYRTISQPHLPADLGFYTNLRLPESRVAQQILPVAMESVDSAMYPLLVPRVSSFCKSPSKGAFRSTVIQTFPFCFWLGQRTLDKKLERTRDKGCVAHQDLFSRRRHPSISGQLHPLAFPGSALHAHRCKPQSFSGS